MSATCFHCHAIADAAEVGPRCPRCDYPLIVTLVPGAAPLHSERRRYVPLPGISAKARIHPTWEERRTARRKAVEAERREVRESARAARKRRLAEVFVASGLLTAIVASLGVLL